MFETIIVIGLASWRIANLLVNEDGPWDIIEIFREKIGLPKVGVIGNGFLPTMLQCIYCTSVYTTIVVYLLWLIAPVAVMLLAAAAVVIIVDSHVNK